MDAMKKAVQNHSKYNPLDPDGCSKGAAQNHNKYPSLEPDWTNLNKARNRNIRLQRIAKFTTQVKTTKVHHLKNNSAGYGFKSHGIEWRLIKDFGISFDFVEKSVAQVAIRWLLQSPPVTSVIVGTTKVHQLEDNMGAAGWRLTEEEVRTTFLYYNFYCWGAKNEGSVLW